MATSHQNFWGSPDHRACLRDGIATYQRIADCKKTDFINLLLGETGDKYPRAEKREIEAVMLGRDRRKAEETSWALHAFCHLLEPFIEQAPQHAAAFEPVHDLRTALEEFLKANPDPGKTPDPPGGRGIPEPADMATFVRLLSHFMKIEAHEFLGVKDIFFTPDELEVPAVNGAHHKWYDLYRYVSDEGDIAKSFIVLTAQGYNDFGAVCFFANYFPKVDDKGIIEPGPGKENARITRGIVVPTDRVVYFVGEIDGGTGLKIMAINKLLRRQTYTGLLISFESDNTVIAARFVMKKSGATDHNDADLRIRPESEFKKELGEDLKKLRHPQRMTAALPMWRAGEKLEPERPTGRTKRSKRP